MSENTDYPAYISDLVYLLRESGADAQRRSTEQSGEGAVFEDGRATAYIEILSLMQTQADAFSIPRESIGLSGFDPVNDPMDPPQQPRAHR